MPKPAPYTQSPQSYSEPYATPFKPNGYSPQVISFFSSISFVFLAMSKPSLNTNKLGTSNSGNRAIQRGSKGSALLNRNDNANQVARCYACGINIR